MTVPANATVVLLQPGDFVGITFWLASMGMAATTVFLFIERGTIAASWRTPVTVVGVITGIAFLHYMYMRSVWVQTGDLPTLYRYVDWIITFPLQAITFYLILATSKKIPTVIFWKLLAAALIMTFSEYLGEAGHLQSFMAFIIAMIGWIYILFEIYLGELSRICGRSGNKPLVNAYNSLRMIVTIGWAIYPLGYIFGYMTSGVDSSALNVIYNLADFVNKIGFGLIVWNAAISNTYLSKR